MPVWLQDFITLSLSVLFEATPFLILGVGLSVAVRLYVPSAWVMKYMPKNGFLRRAYISAVGLFLPVCECGNVPLSRGLILKGLRPSDAIAFLLVAPILNPITITTTIVAFGGDTAIVIGRILGGFLIGNIVAYAMSRKNESEMLTESFQELCKVEPNAQKNSRTLRVFAHEFYDEIGRLMPPLIIGCMVAGLSQVLIPRSVLSAIGGHVVVSILAMMALAFLVSICASVDAFFALSFSGIFSPGSIVAFLVFGPMIDIKMLALMKTTFTKRTLIEITTLVFVLTFALGLGVNYAL